MKTFVVGDVHGCFDELMNLMNKADLDLSVDRLILLGDYIDRGPQSYEVVKYLLGLREIYGSENVILLRGNHEQMAIDYLENGETNWFRNGADETIRSFAAHKADISDMVPFFKTLRLLYIDDLFIYVHAGLRPGIDLYKQEEEDLLWIREDFYDHSFDFGKRVIFGHTPTVFINGEFDPISWKRKIALDTGCVHGGNLSGLEIKNGRITHKYMIPYHIRKGKKSRQRK